MSSLFRMAPVQVSGADSVAVMLAIAPGSFIDDVWENNALPASRNSGFPPSHLSAASFLLAGVVFTVHDALGTASVAIRPATLSILKSDVRLENNCRMSLPNAHETIRPRNRAPDTKTAIACSTFQASHRLPGVICAQ